jgi:hypothetical protein
LLGAPGVATAATGGASAVLAAASAGTAGAVGALVATAAVLAFFVGSASPVLLLDRAGVASPFAFFLVLLGYVLRVVLVGVVAVRLSAESWFGSAAFGGTVIACSLVWGTVATVALTRASRRPRGASAPR